VDDVGRIITWVDLIVGLILVLVGLILIWRRSVTHQAQRMTSPVET
jgi:hypothetical protein